MGLFDNFLGHDTRAQQSSTSFSQEDKIRIAQSAQNIADEINKSLKVFRKTSSRKTKLSHIDKLRHNICAIKSMRARYPFLTLFDLAEIEDEIEQSYNEYIKSGLASDSNNKSNAKHSRREGPPVLPVLSSSAVSGRLAKQCRTLNLPLYEVELKDITNPEFAVCKYFKARGYAGAYCEGGAILTAMKALCLDILAEHNTFNSRRDACNRFFEAQCTVLNDKKYLLLAAISSTNKTRFIDNFKEIYSKEYNVRGYYPGLTADFMSKLYDCIGTESFYNIAERFMDDPYLYRKGWPDLTLVRGNELRFVEVKTTDLLHESQIVTIQAMRGVIPADFSVVRVAVKRTSRGRIVGSGLNS